MMARPLIPLPPEYEDSGHSSPALVTAGIDPTRAAPSVDNKAGSCPVGDLRDSDRPRRYKEAMATDINITASATLADIEKAISGLRPETQIGRGLTARISSNRRSSYFKDIWCAIAVAAGLSAGPTIRVTAWGLQNWSKQDDEDGFALSYPGITALQLGAAVLTDGRFPELLDPARVRRHISAVGGVLGHGGAATHSCRVGPGSPQGNPAHERFGRS